MTGPLRSPALRGGVDAKASTLMAEHGEFCARPGTPEPGVAFFMGTSFELRITDNIRSVIDSITMTERQHRLAVAIAATKTISDVREAVRSEMRSVFDRPTRYSLNAFWIRAATPEDPVAVLEQRAWGGGAVREWLHPQSEGGARSAKAFERALSAAIGLPLGGAQFMPGHSARLDAYGNLSGGLLAQILSDLKATRDSHMWATDRSRKRNRRARHFVMRDRDGTPRYIATRAGGDLRIVLYITARAATYRPRFDFDGVTRRTAAARFAAQYEAATARLLRRQAR